MPITSGAPSGGGRTRRRFAGPTGPSVTQPKAQTVGRTRSVSGSLTRPKFTPAPPPKADTTGSITAPPVGSTPGIFEPGPVTVTPGPGAEGAEGGIDIAAIEAAIAAIEAQFGLTREQLLADQSELGRQYRQLIVQASRAREASIEAVLGNALDRGIVRSGIFAENVTEVEQLNAEQLGDISSSQAASDASTQNAIAVAEAAAAEAKLTAAQQRGGQVLSQEELDALIKAGLA